MGKDVHHVTDSHLDDAERRRRAIDAIVAACAGDPAAGDNLRGLRIVVPEDSLDSLKELTGRAGVRVALTPERRQGERRANRPDDHRVPDGDRRDPARSAVRLTPDEARSLVGRLDLGA